MTFYTQFLRTRLNMVVCLVHVFRQNLKVRLHCFFQTPMRNSILSAKYLLGSVFLVSLFLDRNIAELTNAPNTTDSTKGGVANITSGIITGNTTVGMANISKETANNTVGQAASDTSGRDAGNVSRQAGTGGQPNGTSQSVESVAGSAVNTTSGRGSGVPNRVATNSSDIAASNSSGGFTSSTSRETTSKTIDVSERTTRNSSGAIGGNTTTLSFNNASKDSTTNTLSSTAKDISTVGKLSVAVGANTTPVSSSNASRDSTTETIGTFAKTTSTATNSSVATGANTTPVSSSNASRDSTTKTIGTSARVTSTIGGSVSNSSTAKPLVKSSSIKPEKGSGEVAGTNSRNAKKPVVDSTVWPFDVSTETITTEIPAPPPLEETDPNKKIKEKKPAPSLGPALSPDGKHQKVVCQRILELKMDSDLSNSAARYEVKANSASGRGGISKIRFIHTIGATDNAAEIQNQPLTLDAFKGNDFQRAITFTLSIKILKSRSQSRTPMVLLTNGCIPDHTSLIRAPSINLSFTPGTNTFRVQFNTTETAIDETAVAEPDQNGWFKTVLYFQDQTITLEVNGKKILSKNGMLGTIPKNLCPLLIGGSDIDRNQNFYGYLDNVNIIKDCKFHEANIKVL
ncbi:hypothetical protein ACJMK2_017085 [Sinanodonta woodiana]|uniref:Uncharacterized protein n=1 Tax=Sinanodonta woodiana TaxID=1069815 RepID=A0ABD3UVS6_SINWO